VRYAAENTGLTTKTGGNWSVWNTSPSAGHGATIDYGVLDELFKDKDGRREQAMRPAMATRHDAQKSWCSTAGEEGSVILSRKVAAGREATRNQTGEGICYFEWSAERDDDPEDPATWRACMPALGLTITERTVRAALEESRQTDPTLAEFQRAWLNIPKVDAAAAGLIPPELWAAVNAPTYRPAASVVLAVDARREGDDGATIVACDAAGVVEVVEYHAGPTDWLRARLVDLAERHRAAVVVDVSGPVGYLAGELTSRNVEVVEYRQRDTCHASQAFRIAVADRSVSVRTHDRLTAAVEDCAIRPVGDSWMWSRSTLTDASPLLAASLAYTHATTTATVSPFIM
jgi:hypothetical protein